MALAFYSMEVSILQKRSLETQDILYLEALGDARKEEQGLLPMERWPVYSTLTSQAWTAPALLAGLL